MKHTFGTIAAVAVSVMGSALLPALKADDWNKKTNITIDQSIEVQGVVLAPGSYVIKLLGSSADQRIVQIYNADENHLIGTVLAMPAYRMNAGDTDFQFYAATDGRPRELRTWFYPGDNSGFEFRLGKGQMPAEAGQQRNTKATTSVAGGD